jgi:hypothetical protein
LVEQALRLVDATVLPFKLTDYALAIADYVNATQIVASSISPLLSLSRLSTAANRLLTASREVDRIATSYSNLPTSNANGVNSNGLSAINTRLVQFERQFYYSGLPERVTQHHALIATNPDESYYAEVLPLINDALRLNASLDELQWRIDNITLLFEHAVTWLERPLPMPRV